MLSLLALGVCVTTRATQNVSLVYLRSLGYATALDLDNAPH